MLPTLIAVVDDDAAICGMVVEILTDEGYLVVCYADGASFLNEVGQVRPNLLLLDIHRQHRPNGWEILLDLHRQPATNDMPIILSTADVQFVQEHSDDVNALGATILHKPFELDKFLDTVAQVLRGELVVRT